MGIKNKFVLLGSGLSLFLLKISFSFAYIDPGTGGMVFNSIWLFIAGIFGAISAFIGLYLVKPVRKWIRKLRKKD